MENASKALIIAGTILLAILIIGLGVFIYNQASNTVSDTGMDQIAVRQFNAQFEPYIMNNASGTTAMALYDTVMTHNAIAESGKKVRLELQERLPTFIEDSSGHMVKKSTSFTEFDEDIKFVKLASKSIKQVDDDLKMAAEDAGKAEKAGVKEETWISFNKSALSATKRYNITVSEYDGGVIKIIVIASV